MNQKKKHLALHCFQSFVLLISLVIFYHAYILSTVTDFLQTNELVLKHHEHHENISFMKVTLIVKMKK
jgi:hypothetical protein